MAPRSSIVGIDSPEALEKALRAAYYLADEGPVEHTARTGADKGFLMIVPEDCCSTMNAAWHNASVNFALQKVAVVTDADAVIKALG